MIVTFNPDIAALQKLLNAITPQIDSLVVVDNGSDVDLRQVAEHSQLKLLALGDNYGISHAQNVGINFAREDHATFVLLLDQDSLPAPDMVAELVAATLQLQAQGKKVAAVGPDYIDHRQGETASFVYRKGMVLKRRPSPSPDPVVEADFLIASGSLIPLQALDEIGDMIEEMFIDYVDIEWGLRARDLGYLCYGVFAARMDHSLGDDHIPFRGHRVPLHSSLRHYYQLRNAVWLARRPWLPKIWILLLVWRMGRQFLFFTVSAPNGLDHARMMTIGIWDGIRGRMGRK